MNKFKIEDGPYEIKCHDCEDGILDTHGVLHRPSGVVPIDGSIRIEQGRKEDQLLDEEVEYGVVVPGLHLTGEAEYENTIVRFAAGRVYDVRKVIF